MIKQSDKPDSDHHCIPGLESVLRKKMGDDLIVKNYTATNLLARGENYASLVLKVDALLSREKKDSESENLHMVAKVPPSGMWQRDLFNSPACFEKEIFMYETILPCYKEIERKCGINDEDTFNMGPAFYGSRLNLDFGDVFDDNAVILLENLNPRGYYTGNRYTGLDLDHLRIVVKAVARFHALGIAVKTKNHDVFEVLKARSKSIPLKEMPGMLEIKKAINRFIKEDEVMSEYYDVCAKALDGGAFFPPTTDVPEDPWSTIIHCDLWANNILFHQNEESGLPDDVKFVDFQFYLIQSSLRDLSFVLGILSNQEVITKHIPELIDLYYETFISRLELMGCDISSYSRDKFDERLSKDALLEFSHITRMLKVSTANVDPNTPVSEEPIKDLLRTGLDDFYARIRPLVTGYAKRGWFQKASQI